MLEIGTVCITQWFIRWVGGEDQAQRESYIEIHQHHPSNRANSHHNKTNEARKNSNSYSTQQNKGGKIQKLKKIILQ